MPRIYDKDFTFYGGSSAPEKEYTEEEKSQLECKGVYLHLKRTESIAQTLVESLKKKDVTSLFACIQEQDLPDGYDFDPTVKPYEPPKIPIKETNV